MIRDSNGDYVLASCCYYTHCRDAFEAEVLALRDGLRTAMAYTAQPLLFQTDCANLVRALKEKGQNKSAVGHLVNEVKEMVGEGRELCIDVIKRKNNRVADRLAYISRAEHRTDLLLQDAPDALVDILDADCNPIIE